MTKPVSRPVLQYHGGKWKLAPWIISHFPAHRVYVEPFGGAASVLLRKERSYNEVYNDLDDEIVNLFRVLRDPAQARELVRLVHLTPFARNEFEISYLTDDDPLEQARRTIARSFMGFSTSLTGKWRVGFRGGSNRSGTNPARAWLNYPNILETIIERLRGVVIESNSAVAVMRHYDTPQTLHYLDPPYPISTRGKWAGNSYKHEMSDDDHRNLSEALRDLSGMVIISGYTCELYDDLYSLWQCIRRKSYADGAKERTECLWLSPKTTEALNGGSMVGGLFGLANQIY